MTSRNERKVFQDGNEVIFQDFLNGIKQYRFARMSLNYKDFQTAGLKKKYISQQIQRLTWFYSLLERQYNNIFKKVKSIQFHPFGRPFTLIANKVKYSLRCKSMAVPKSILNAVNKLLLIDSTSCTTCQFKNKPLLCYVVKNFVFVKTLEFDLLQVK